MQEEQNARFPEDNNNTAFNLLTPEQTERAEKYLMKMFPHLSLQRITSDLDIYLNDKQAFANQQYYNQPQQQGSSSKTARYTRKKVSTLAREDIREYVREERVANAEERMRISAAFFCEEGLNPRKVSKLQLDISQSAFRGMIDSIMKTITEKLFKGIRLKYKVVIDLSPNEKVLIRDQLAKAHDWMAKQNLAAFATLLKLIKQEYLRVRAMLEDAELGELYNTIAKRVSCNMIDLMEIGERGKNFGPEIEEKFPAIQQEPVFKMNKKKVSVVAVESGKSKVEAKRPREESSNVQRSEEGSEEEIEETAAGEKPEPLDYSNDVQYLLDE